MKTIIEMAREAWFVENQGNVYGGHLELERFAALVAAAATEAANARANTSWALMCKKMVAAEKEACAKLADEYATWGGSNFFAWFKKLSADIRARGQA